MFLTLLKYFVCADWKITVAESGLLLLITSYRNIKVISKYSKKYGIFLWGINVRSGLV